MRQMKARGGGGSRLSYTTCRSRVKYPRDRRARETSVREGHNPTHRRFAPAAAAAEHPAPGRREKKRTSRLGPGCPPRRTAPPGRARPLWRARHGERSCGVRGTVVASAAAGAAGSTPNAAGRSAPSDSAPRYARRHASSGNIRCPKAAQEPPLYRSGAWRGRRPSHPRPAFAVLFGRSLSDPAAAIWLVWRG